MKIYLAGIESLTDKEREYVERNGTNGLASFYNMNQKTEEVIPYLKDFLLDSGAFTLFSSGKHVDWNSYIKSFAEFINRNKVSKFFELDIDSLVGYEKVLELRHKLEDATGKPVIPVWHKSRGKERFLQMCEEYKYVAIGGIVSKEIKISDYPVFNYLIDEAHKRGVRIHGLGFTNMQGLKKYHFDSVDSTAWISGNKYGFIYHFNGTQMKKTTVPKGYRFGKTTWSDARLNNLTEWDKFVQYAENKL